MKIKLLKLMCLSGLMFTSTVFATTAVLEDFSQGISLSKYWSAEESILIDDTNQRLNFSQKAKANKENARGNFGVLKNGDINLIQADLTLISISLGNSSTQQALFSIGGTFYNANNAAPTSALGDVFVRLAIGDRGNGPEAWYEIFTSTTTDFTKSTVVTGKLGDVTLDTTYPVSIFYDGTKTFTFNFNNGEAIPVDGPNRLGATSRSGRTVGTVLRFGGVNSTPNDLVDVVADDKTLATISGHMDNLTSEAGLLDDFSNTNLSQAIWNFDQYSTTIVNQNLEMKVHNQVSEIKSVNLIPRQKRMTSFGATVTLLSSSTQNATTRIQALLGHHLSNDTYNAANGDVMNGYEGAIETYFVIERKEGVNRATVSAARSEDAAGDKSSDIFFETIKEINFDQPYVLLIEQDGTVVTYKMDGTLVYTVDLATYVTEEEGSAYVPTGNLYAPSGEVESYIFTRVGMAAGKAHARFDDIVADAASVTAANAADATPASASSGGSGAFNPLPFISVWLLLIGFRLGRRYVN